MNVVVDGLMTNYLKVGKGPAIVMLHGWGDSARTFNMLAEELKDRYEIYALDLPGFGGTQAPSKAWGLDDYATFVEAWLKKIGVNKVKAIVGHSNGGAIAIKAVSSGKIKTDKLVLIASAGIRHKNQTRKKVLKAAASTGKAATFFLPSKSKNKIRDRFYGSIGSDITLVPELEETFRKIVAEDVQPAAHGIHIQTLLIYGHKDKATPLSFGRIYNSLIPNSRLEMIDGGHFMHQDQSDKIAGLVSDFMGAK
jgi:pimeloyl-ACP methyl ester carboxylesterase